LQVRISSAKFGLWLLRNSNSIMENETLKQLVLAKSEAIAPEAGTTYTTKNGTILRTNDRQIGDKCNQWHVSEYRGNSYVAYCYGDDTPADNHVWAIAADCLDIAQPVPFFESQLHELCVALGWQGGTYHMVLAEVKRLKSYESDNREPSHC
jgi:hypothetical protein